MGADFIYCLKESQLYRLEPVKLAWVGYYFKL
jgi:hypothetical protein